MTFQKSVIETIRTRQSIRTYDTQDITESDYKIITEYIDNKQNLIGPFNSKGKMELIRVTDNVTDKGIKLGTYGFIKNPKAYLVGICENNTYSLVNFSYTFEKLVLFLTDLQIGTCWMGGTFSRKSFEKEISIGEREFIPCVTPIGYPKEKQRMFDKALRIVVKADNKKAWNQLFYDESFEAVLDYNKAGPFQTPIESVRLGPSASNKQPWRLVLANDRTVCHFFIEHTPNYSTKLGYQMQLLDIGIAMCHFDLTCKELKMHGEWEIEDPKLERLNEQAEYIASWRIC
ncbi:nitroreductase family protein [Alkalihalobacillus deserti]|uniref:nitroreductase family protein n=1 Tax=Alkalihalobacillus deserti TaxID=2879466 RepID=UPI001D14E1C4|nr:nitroreductase family protein [Alkalihalobacillus deserti]